MILTDAQKTEIGPMPGPGIYLNVPAEQYFAWPHLSKSGLSDFAKSPALWYLRQTGEIERKSSPAFGLGTATNVLWVERGELTDANAIQIAPKINPLTDKPLPATGKARDAYAASLPNGTTLITQAQADQAQLMATALEGNDRAQRLHAGSHAEVSLVWRCPHTGILLKGRPDLVDLERCVLSDLKTTKEIRPFAFDRDAASYNYHWQLHLYTQGLVANGCGSYDDWAQWLITVRNEQPHGVACRPMPASALELAADETAHHIRRWCDCRDNNDWPADDLDEKPIEFPRWRFNQGRIEG